MTRVLGEPSGRPTCFQFGFGPLEQVPIILGVAAREPFALAAHAKLLDCVRAGRVKQPEPRFGAADIRDNQRFRHQIGQTVYRIDACICCVPSDICSSLDRKAASEDPKGSEELLLVLAQ